jgi:hypothetical protein
VFHFNKKHLEDPEVPMWVVKTHGETFYVNHVTADMPWSTKETPDNSHTKGSIKFKECLLVINADNEATLSKLSVIDRIRLRNQRLGITRIIFYYGGAMHQALRDNEFKHSPFKNVTGGCGTSFVVCDLLRKEEATFASMKYDFRIMSPNEAYYQAYDAPGTYIDEDDYPNLDDDDE